MYGSCQVSSPLSFFRCSALRFVHLIRVFLARPSHFWLVRVQTWPRAVHCVMLAFPIPRASDARDLCSDAHFYSTYTVGDVSVINFAFNTRLTRLDLASFLLYLIRKNPNLFAFIRLVYIFLIIFDYNFCRHWVGVFSYF